MSDTLIPGTVILPDGAVNQAGEMLVRRWTVTQPGSATYLIDLSPFGEYQVFRGGEYVTAVGTLAEAAALAEDLGTPEAPGGKQLTGPETELVPVEAVQPETWRTVHTDAPLRAVRGTVAALLDLTIDVENELVNVSDRGVGWVAAWVPAVRETAVVDVLLHAGYQVTVTDAGSDEGRVVYNGGV